MSKLYQLEYTFRMIIICIITVVLLVPCVYIADLNIYIHEFYISPFIALVIATYIQYKFINVTCVQRD